MELGQHFGVHPSTLRRWANNNLVEFKRTVGNQRIYNINNKSTKQSKPNNSSYIYVRVSSQKQKEDVKKLSSKSLNLSFQHN